jgi:hypothetical protein
MKKSDFKHYILAAAGIFGLVGIAAAPVAIAQSAPPDPHAANVQQHDVRHDQDELMKNHNQAAHDQRALAKAEASGNKAAIAHDKAALHDARHDEHGDHHLASEHRRAQTKDMQ